MVLPVGGRLEERKGELVVAGRRTDGECSAALERRPVARVAELEACEARREVQQVLGACDRQGGVRGLQMVRVDGDGGVEVALVEVRPRDADGERLGPVRRGDRRGGGGGEGVLVGR